MIGDLIDAALEPLFPRWVYQRRFFRQSMNLFAKRAVSSGGRTEARRSWSSQGPVDKTRALATTRRQARQLYRENPYCRGGINSIVANLIGLGIRPLPKVRMPKKGDLDKRTNDRLLALWDQFCRQSDSQCRANYYLTQSRVMRELYVAGEALIHLPSAPRDGRMLPLAVDVIAAERLAEDVDNQKRGEPRIVQGVEFDAHGKIAAYHIYPSNPDESTMFSARNSAVRMDASEIIHIYAESEPGQVRGESRLLPIAPTCEAHDQWLDFVLTKERVAAAFVAMVSKEFGGIAKVGLDAGSALDDTDDASNLVESIEGGMLFKGRPGESLKGFSSGVMGSQVDKLSQVFLRMMARGLDVSYELLSRDLSNVTYLSARQGENQDRRHWEPQQEVINCELNMVVWDRVIEAVFRAGLLPQEATPETIERFKAVEWVRPGWDWIDPAKDIQGDILAIQAGLESPINAIKKRGRNPHRIVEEIKEYKDMAEAKDLNLAIFEEEEPEAVQPTAEGAPPGKNRLPKALNGNGSSSNGR